MNPSAFSVSVPEPCHEDWNLMQPDVNGKFCCICQKTVIDFTGKSASEIQTILWAHRDQRICGHLKKTQIQRPLELPFNFRDLPDNLSITKTFTIALFLVFGTLLFSCTTNQDETVDRIDWVAEDTPNVTGLTYISMDTPDPGCETDTFTPSFRREEFVNGEIALSGAVEK